MKKAAILISILALLTSCFPDERLSNMVPDSLGLSSTEVFQEASVHTGNYVLGVVKSGIGQSEATVEVSIGDEDGFIDSFNQKNNSEYKAVSPALIRLDKSSIHFGVKDASSPITLQWDPEELVTAIGLDTVYVIPVKVKSSDLEVKDARSWALIRLTRTSVKVKQPQVQRVVDKTKVEKDKKGVQPPLQETVKLDINLDNAIKGMDLTIPVKIDYSLIDPFNEGSDIQYQAPLNLDKDLVTIETPSITVPGGSKSASFNVSIDYSVLLDENGKLKEFPSYVVPVTIDQDKVSALYKGEDFDINGLFYDNMTAYLTFDWKEVFNGVNIRREWGKYSETETVWSDYIDGFTAGNERNVTLDGDYIYIAEANTTKNLWAISLRDGGTAKKLPVGTVNDVGTFYLSCPRVMPNEEADINGGKPVLLVSSMGMEGTDPMLYVYLNGTDKDPVAINMTTWAQRRLGDTFTWWGNYKNGVLFFKDYDSAQGTVTFRTNGNKEGTIYLASRVQAPAVTGGGGYFPYPEDINTGFASTRGGTKSWFVHSNQDLKGQTPDNSPTTEEMDADWADCAFRFLDFKGKRYIAVAKQDSSTAGRLIIVEGDKDQDWKSIIKKKNIIYQAAIQNDTENASLDKSPSPQSSGNSGMDLDVWQTDDDIYVAVVKQKVGLSLFHIIYLSDEE